MKLRNKELLKKVMSLSLITMLSASVLTGCSTKGTDSEVKGSADTQKELVLGSVRDIVPGDGDAYYVSLASYVWEALTMDNAGTIEPWLAKSWEHNKDCTEWTFKLRDDVKFHDGTKFDADAVLANIERYKKGPLTSTYTSLDINKSFPNLKEAVKVDDYTVKFVFSEGVATLDYLVADLGSPMFSPKCFDEETGAVKSFVQGTGRYKIAEHKPDQYAVLQRNDEYYGEDIPKMEKITVKCIPDSETRYSALKSEEVMSLMDNGAMMTSVADQLVKEDERFKMEKTKSHMTHWLMVNGENEYLSNVKMRQAISYAIDRETINKTLYGGLLEPAYSILNHQSQFFKDIKGEYNLDKAKKLSKEVLGDKRLTARLAITQSKAENYPLKGCAEYIQSALKEIGVDVEIQMLENSVYNKNMEAGEYELSINPTGLMNADPHSTLEGYMGSKTTGWNNKWHFNYRNEKIDKLLHEAQNTTDNNRRKEIYHEIQDIAAAELPLIPLLYDVNLNVHNKKVKGYTSEKFDNISLPTIEWNN